MDEKSSPDVPTNNLSAEKSIEEHAKKRKKWPLWTAISLFLIVIILAVPLPYFGTITTFCSFEGTNCPTSTHKYLFFGQPLGLQLLGAITNSSKQSSKQVACTQEAKLCPDGSYVSRTGPKCEFAACPAVSPTPNLTANWKTYTNSEIGYSLKYPPYFTVSKEYTSIVFTPSTVTLAVPTTDPLYAARDIRISVIDSPFAEPKAQPPALSDVKPITINGVQGYHYTEQGAPYFSQVIDLPYQSKTLRIQGDINDPSYNQDFMNMAQTLKFTDQTSAGDTNGWKTYIDPLYHFVLKYPSAWNQEQASRSTQVEMGVQPYGVGYRIDNQNDPKQAPLFVSVSVYENPSKQDLQAWFTQLNKDHFGELHVLDQQITIGGRTGIRARQQPEFENDFVNYVSADGKVNLIYNFVFGGNGEGGGNYADNDPFVQTEREDFAAFLSSFAFTK